MTARKTLIIYSALLCYTVAPIVSVMIAAGIAKLTGAALDEGDVHRCVVLGVDIGGALYNMAVAGWLGLVTLPSGGLAILIFSLVRPAITRSDAG